MKSLLATILLSSAIVLPCQAETVTWTINDQSKRDEVRFSSDAPVELISGATHQITGIIQHDDSFQFDTNHPFKVRFEVDLASIDTGIPLRNEHMRDNFLETSKYPKAIFKANAIKTKATSPLKPGQTVVLMADGDLTLHGQTQRITVPLKATYLPESATTKQRFPSGDLVRIKGTFPVKLEEFGISRPEALFYKLAETVFITVDVTANEKLPSQAVSKN